VTPDELEAGRWNALVLSLQPETEKTNENTPKAAPEINI
jgi:hypothetical protein